MMNSFVEDNASAESFDSFSLHPDLLRAVKELGFSRPTPVQVQAIPVISAGRDLTGTAQTGSGKTAAYLLPILNWLLVARSDPSAPHHPRTRVLVLVPTRELALQVEGVAKDLARFTKIRAAAVYGGVGMEPQTKALRAGVEIVAATPGRLLDHMGIGNTRFDRLSFLVLDEADRMLDIGFMPDIRRIVERLPTNRQTLLFSATMPPAVASLAASIQKDPAQVSVGEALARPKIPDGIDHKIYPIPMHLKTALLVRILKDSPMPSVLVFARTRHRADMVAAELARAGYTVKCIHSDFSQPERIAALEAFRARKVQILVATDIAARGLDIEDISHVINYDLPQSVEDYIHRVGRTGRAEATGEAASLVSLEELHQLAAIEAEIGRSVPRLFYPGFADGAESPQAPPGTAARTGPVVYTPPPQRPGVRRGVRRTR